MMDVHGQKVVLRGVNVGGWLLQESYILRTDTLNSQGRIQAALLRTMPEKKVEDFYRRFRNSFVTKADIDFLADQGFNCVRVPFHYDLFLTPRQRAFRRQALLKPALRAAYADSIAAWNDRGQLFTGRNLEGFRHLDDVLRWCGARNLYVVLDLHAAPGGQGVDRNINDNMAPLDLWKRRDSKGRLVYQDATVQLWKQLAARYRQDARIAIYDLINEPHGLSAKNGLSDDNQELRTLYIRLLEAVRGQSDQHLLMLEGNGYGNEYTNLTPDKLPEALRPNLVYNAHRYWCTNEATAGDPNPNQINLFRNLAAFRDQWQVPVWVGETGENANEWFAAAVTELNKLNIGWCHWNIKRVEATTGIFSLPDYGSILTPAGRTALLRNAQFKHNKINRDVVQALIRPVEGARAFNAQQQLPGLLVAAHYDLGRAGLAYQDTYSQRTEFVQRENWNLGSQYRNDGVDLSEVADPMAHNVAVDLLEPNEWLQYSVSVTQPGACQVQARVANATSSAAVLQVLLDGQPLTEITVPPTGQNGSWVTLTVPGGTLPAGEHQVRIVTAQPGARLSWLRFERPAVPASGMTGAMR
ncbi:cellulase family glycosylhydrolase [Hymenobacter guriensis]|uniref:Cellulase family glycosylhydrolase n=1 Tax=Hymenobacter guriensis TaxID=2793065 RepID=A0ABS0L6G6_9BACT|nr:cellulase family glycosylhydrolase [Hymenobacter guriensis]MBG8555694.1 cellulase family glycosylhydrolase [Hymenobacter guriensis]